MVKTLQNLISRLSYFRGRVCAPRWMVFIIDAGFSLIAVLIAGLLVLNFYPELGWRPVLLVGSSMFVVRLASFYFFKTYSGVVRYTGSQDVFRIFYVLLVGDALFLTGMLIAILLGHTGLMVSVLIWVEFSILLCLMIFSRLVFKMLFARHFLRDGDTRKVAIYGSNEYLLMVRHILSNARNVRYDVKAFIESDNISAGKYLSGIKIYHPLDLAHVIKKYRIDTLILAQKMLSAEKRKELIESCIEHGASVKEIPNLEKLISGEMSVTQMRDVKVEDLLQRDPIDLDTANISRELKGKTILVTGAAGSIGSEIVRQLTRFSPARVVLLDIAESPMYELELELAERLGFTDFVTELCSIRDVDYVDDVFRRHKPSVVYHAAAYKHVPMMEKLPMEGVKTNIFGTKNVADAAIRHKSEKFVMVSTDKAVNPTNVMGCTKRIAEIYIQSQVGRSDTAFITTRFGNVLGSNGSVIPRFARQIEEGGPVTVTHPDVTRFFMTIPEACQLVLQAGTLGQGGEIFVFDMGKSVKIVDMARNMIRLSGFEVGKDIEIKFTGLRPGEKLYEEVLNDKEEVLPTLHGRINRAKVREYPVDQVERAIQEMQATLSCCDHFAMVRLMKELVPEFISQHSVYEALDKQSNRA